MPVMVAGVTPMSPLRLLGCTAALDDEDRQAAQLLDREGNLQQCAQSSTDAVDADLLGEAEDRRHVGRHRGVVARPVSATRERELLRFSGAVRAPERCHRVTPEKLHGLLEQVATGALTVPVAATNPLTGATAALAAFGGGKLGKIVVTVP